MTLKLEAQEEALWHGGEEAQSKGHEVPRGQKGPWWHKL